MAGKPYGAKLPGSEIVRRAKRPDNHGNLENGLNAALARWATKDKERRAAKLWRHNE